MGEPRPPRPANDPANPPRQDAAGWGRSHQPSVGHRSSSPGPPGSGGEDEAIGLPPGSPAPESSATRIRHALAHGGPAERVAAIRSAPPGPGLEPVLIEALADPEPVVRMTAVRALAALARTRGTRALMRVSMADPSPDVRMDAVGAVGRILAGRVGLEERPSRGRPV
ncbi:MAG TPA: HEAT repeat domain-containing protein [Actinomycetota bacterium]